MDKSNSKIRSLTTELINLKEEFFSDPVEIIVNQLHSSSEGTLIPPPDTSTDSIETLPKEKSAKQKKNDKREISKASTEFISKNKNLVCSEPELGGLSAVVGFNLNSRWGILLVLCLAIWIQLYRTPSFKPKLWWRIAKKESCWMETPLVIQEIGRQAFNCKACSKLTEFPVVHNITPQEFIKTYAYSGIPVLIKGAIGNWSALNTFSYDFFRNTYKKYKDGFSFQEENAQFFPYKSGFGSLSQALQMSKKRKMKPWYFGWSNAHPEIGELLRKHYERPYFLPPDSESSATDWIFMGTPNRGAHVHIDYVNRPSWQAQIKGIKQWFLRPSPECMSTCIDINVTVTPGDIIVVDTNQWYHSTFTHKGDISITIGSEYD